LLELAGTEKLGHFNNLISFNEVNSDIERMILIMRWFFSYISDLKPDKKPYNPVIGETHVCRSYTEEHGETKFYAEQVSHHPPVTAFTARNKTKKINVDGNITFGVRFETNSVICSTDGFLNVYSSDPELEGEVYSLSKGLPDLQINNVILGTRTMGWTGNISITCAKNGLSVPLKFTKNKTRVFVEGKINRGTEELYEFNGFYEEQPLIAYPVTTGDNHSILLFDKNAVSKSEIVYPFPYKVPELNTFKVWSSVTESIVKGDMNLADIEKKRIEAEQRRRAKTWTSNDFIYFKQEEGTNRWIFSKKKKEVEHTAS
jgi:hypothetical protein